MNIGDMEGLIFRSSSGQELASFDRYMGTCLRSCKTRTCKPSHKMSVATTSCSMAVLLAFGTTRPPRFRSSHHRKLRSQHASSSHRLPHCGEAR